MELRIDPANATPIYAQVVDQIRSLVASRALRAGDQLPSVRDLAVTLRVNRNTAAKAYQVLEADGVIETRAGQGSFVADGTPRWSREERYRRVEHALDRSLVEAHHLDVAVDNLSFEVPRGSIFGLLGQNGAGKSTTIRTLLNLLQPTSGRLSVLGLDSVTGSLALRRRVGYLPEDPTYYPWMTVEEIVRFNSAFYPTWDSSLVDSLVKQLGLPRGRRLKALSRGMQAKVGLVLALGSRPEVLILDDPTSGLDPVVRREFLEAMIANTQSEGGTVLFSTHLLHEMERVADEVAILHEGKLRMRASLERVKSDTKKLRAIYPEKIPESFPIDGLLRVERNHHQALLTVARFDGSMPDKLRGAGAESVEVIDLSLEEIFVETVKGGTAH